MKNIKAHLALFSVALIYGANYTIAKEVLDPGYIKPTGFILLRAATGAILFGQVGFLFIKEKVEKSDFKLLVLCGLFGVFLNQVPFFIGLQMTTAIHASLIMTITPIIVLISASILLKEAITKIKVLGIFLGMIGAAFLILSGGEIDFHSEQLIGDLLILLNAMSYGFYLVLVRKLMIKYHPFTVLRWVFFFGFFMVLPFGCNDLTVVEWSALPNWIWLAVAYVMLFTTFFAYLLNAFALGRVSASIAGIYIYLQPIIATTIAIFFAKDVLTVEKLLSASLIFLGVFLVSKKQSRTEPNT